MMNETLYSMIHKRRSFRQFRNEKLSREKCMEVISGYNGEIGTFKLVDRSQTSCPIGDVCLLYYGDRDNPMDLLQAGYRLEKLELYLQANSIGACWYGFGRTKERNYEGKDFLIMLTLGYLEEDKLRKSDDEFKRNSIDEICDGDFDKRVLEDVRLAPSACNSQPWKIVSEGSRIDVYRTEGNKSIMVGRFKEYFNTIDIGIFLAFLEISLAHHGYRFEKDILGTKGLFAKYNIIDSFDFNCEIIKT